MKRLHVHVAVRNLDESVRFYSTLFATGPTVLKDDYAKWMLDDPRVNFAISTHGEATGVDHLGIQVENDSELREVYGRLRQADRPVLEEGTTTCCYAQSEKSWIADPQGVTWETFHTIGESTTYGTSVDLKMLTQAQSSCCAPTAKVEAAPKSACCAPAQAVSS